MDIIHNAIAWYQKKIGSYDKQLWEQSVEKKLLKSPPNVHSGPKKSVRHKTEYIDVDLIRGSTFSKTKPQVPWLYITRKAFARVLFFPFYYKWWVLQTSRKLYIILVGLYFLQVLTMIIYIWSSDDSITEDEVSLTVVTLPLILMFLLCLVHSQTVLAHITHKPPKRNKHLLELVRKSKPKKATRKGRRSSGHRSSGNNSSACPEENVPRDSSSKQAKGFANPPLSPVTESPGSSQIHTSAVSPPLLDNRQQESSGLYSKKCVKPSALPSEPHSDQVDASRPDELSESLNKGASSYSFNTNPNVFSGCRSGDENIIRHRTVHPQSNSKAQNDDSALGINRQKEAVAATFSIVPSSSSFPSLPSHFQGAKTEHCRFDVLDNLPEVRTREQVLRDFSSQTDKSPMTQAGPLPERGRFSSTLKEDVSISSAGLYELDLFETEREKQLPEKNVTQSTLIREMSGESAISGHSDHHSSSEFECIDEAIIQSDAGPSDKHAHHVSSSSSCERKRHVPSSAQNSLACQRDQSSPDSGISCQPNLTQLKTAANNTSKYEYYPSSLCEGFCRRCSLDNKAHIIQPQSPTPCMVLTKTDMDLCIENSVNSPSPDFHPGDKPMCSYHSQRSHHAHSCPETHFKTNDHAHSLSSIEIAKDLKSSGHYPSEHVREDHRATRLTLDSSGLQCFSEQLVQGILNVDTLREVSSSSLQANSAMDNRSLLSERSQLSNASSTSSSSSLSASLDETTPEASQQPPPVSILGWKSTNSAPSMCADANGISISERRQFSGKLLLHGQENDMGKIVNSLDESMEQIVSDVERTSDGSNYNPSDSEPDSDTAATARLRNKCEEKRFKRLRFQEHSISSSSGFVSPSKANSVKLGASKGGTNICVSSAFNGQRSSFVELLTRKPLPLKELMLGRKTSPTLQTHSSGSDVCQSDTRTSVRRRRKISGNQVDATADANRSRSMPNSLTLHPQEKTKLASSSDNENVDAHTPEGSNKATISSEEWEDRMQSDESTSSTYTSSTVNTDSEGNEYGENGEEERTDYPISTMHVINLLQPSGASPTSGTITQPDKVSSVIWEGNECKKVNLTALDIGWAIIDKVDSLPESSDYFLIGLLFSLIMALMPVMFRLYINKDLICPSELLTWSGLWSRLSELLQWSHASHWRQGLLMINGILQRFVLSLLFFFLLCVADRTFKQRLLYAKHFSYLTSSRRARKFSMPHFRLNKVRNIKIWLSLRSYLKRRGPQRSVDVIVSASFLCAIIIVSLISLQVLKDSDSYLDFLCNWELAIWFLALAVFLMRFMTLGLKINKKYRNLSVLITEQINLYLQMEQKPHKKEELILANNVLRLAEDLLKELESPFKISGFSANPLIYNITKVIVLSAFSAVLTEVLGFKLKLHKIKLKG